MTVVVVYFLEEIHIDHDEYQISVIEFSDIATTHTMIVPKNLLRLRGQNLLEVTPIPHPCKRIGK